jgi:hypothetical protein
MADDPELTEDGYPTDETLERIANAPAREALELAERAWHWDGWASRRLSDAEHRVVHADADDDSGEFVRFATGGWSGNESIVGALNENPMVRVMCWQLSARGGLHIYKLPKSSDSVETE